MHTLDSAKATDRRGPPASPAAFLVVLLTFGALPADAQICAGRASFNIAPTHFEFDIGANSSGRGIGVSVGHGKDALFGIVSGATHTVDGTERVNTIAGTIGTDQPLSPDYKFHVCPSITVGYASDRAGATGVGVSAAGDIAMLAVNTPDLRVMPTLSLELPYNGVGRAVGLFADDASRRYRTFSAGIGFLIRNRLSLVPRVVVPFGPVDRSAIQITVGYQLYR